MKKQLPAWSDRQRRAAERQRRTWEDFFSSTSRQATPVTVDFELEGPAAALSATLARHETELLGYPNVVAVAPGVRMAKGKITGEHCLVVYVSRKLPRGRLGKGGILPKRIEGLPVDVVEAGEIKPLPL